MRTYDKKRLILHRGFIILLLRLCLGGLFLYTSLYKILNTALFKEAVANYELLPYWIVNMTAVVRSTALAGALDWNSPHSGCLR